MDVYVSGSLTKEQLDFYNEEGYLVLPELLTEEDLQAVKQAMSQKVTQIAGELLAAGLITDTLVDTPFPNRLADLFKDLSAEEFLK